MLPLFVSQNEKVNVNMLTWGILRVWMGDSILFHFALQQAKPIKGHFFAVVAVCYRTRYETMYTSLC